MTFIYEGQITLIDEQGLKTRLRFDLGTTVGADDAAEVGPVWDTLRSISTALDAVTTANQLQVAINIRDTAFENGALPAEAEVPEEAAIAVHLVAAPDPEKLHYLRIPAPVDALFLADGVTVDTGNALLQGYIAELANIEVSDGETIVVARGDGGIKKGHLRFKSRSGRTI